jgi:glucosamine--fructose-6-phosphate aminotransferase (isomerizing)
LVVAISASGEVARTLEAVEIAASRGGHTLALTSTEGSSLAEASAHALVLPTVEYPHGPGLLSYLGSLMGCIALAVELFDLPEIASALEILPRQLARWTDEQRLLGASMAEGENESGIVFAGGGPGYAAALFAAAKVVEAAGEYAWGQDLEEWAHLEYFCNPPEMATWFLDSGGRCQSRVQEVEAAAKAIGRRMIVSRWLGAPSWSGDLREALSPLALWPGPVAYAEKRRELLGERPFRGFTGGRSREEGGGASRIRTSRRLTAENLKN